MNILYAASEAVPYAASGGLADVAGSLPRALNKAGQDCRVVLPLYKSCKPELRAGLEFITNFTVDVGWRKQYCGVFKGEINGVTYYLLDNEYYFGRDGLYGFYDDCERFVFLSRAVMEMLKYIGWKPDVINCNDWQTALVPVYYNVFYKYQYGYDNIKTVFTIHNIQYQGKYGMELMEDVLDYLGIALANTINTISPREVMVDGHMLDSLHNQQILLRSVERNIFRVHADQIKFSFRPYDPFGGAKGAAAVVVRELLLHSAL